MIMAESAEQIDHSLNADTRYEEPSTSDIECPTTNRAETPPPPYPLPPRTPPPSHKISPPPITPLAWSIFDDQEVLTPLTTPSLWSAPMSPRDKSEVNRTVSDEELAIFPTHSSQSAPTTDDADDRVTGYLVYSCLQCAVKRMPCSKGLTACSRCVRGGKEDACVVQVVQLSTKRPRSLREKVERIVSLAQLANKQGKAHVNCRILAETEVRFLQLCHGRLADWNLQLLQQLGDLADRKNWTAPQQPENNKGGHFSANGHHRSRLQSMETARQGEGAPDFWTAQDVHAYITELT